MIQKKGYHRLNYFSLVILAEIPQTLNCKLIIIEKSYSFSSNGHKNDIRDVGPSGMKVKSVILTQVLDRTINQKRNSKRRRIS